MESEKPSGFKLFWIQFKLLLRKNIAVKKRNRNATIIQFCEWSALRRHAPAPAHAASCSAQWCLSS